MSDFDNKPCEKFTKKVICNELNKHLQYTRSNEMNRIGNGPSIDNFNWMLTHFNCINRTNRGWNNTHSGPKQYQPSGKWY